MAAWNLRHSIGQFSFAVLPLPFLNSAFHRFRRVPCYHGMARPQVADGGDDLQV
jgi:hypothetical protein